MSKSVAISFLLALLVAAPSSLFGQDRIVKGKIIKIEDGERKTFNSIPVTLYNPDRESRSSPSITNNSGIYYLYDISEGQYKLEVWTSGEIGQERGSSVNIFDVTINYDEAVSNENSKILKLDPVEINT